MFRQEVDPLADTVPPRYAYESDDEDELADLPSSNPAKTAVDVSIVIAGGNDAGEGRTLIIASGEVGALWARGANLGQQIGLVAVNKRTIGLVFRPGWTSSPVIISEALSRLPVWAMHPYAEIIISHWSPSSIVILDAYSTATYVSPAPTPHHEAPLRFLHSGPSPPPAPSGAPLKPFAPPNLLQTTSAAFASILALPVHGMPSPPTFALLLAPSSRAPKPTPHLLQRTDDDEGDTSGSDASALLGLEASEEWDPNTLRAAHGILLAWAGADGAAEWKGSAGVEESRHSPARRRAAADNSMYI